MNRFTFVRVRGVDRSRRRIARAAIWALTTSLATVVSAAGTQAGAASPHDAAVDARPHIRTSRAARPGPQHSFRVWRGGDASLPNHTILRPADLNQVHYRMPIIVWANGGCRTSNEEYRYFLTQFASFGTFIVANGAPENPYEVTELAGVANPQPKLLTEAIDWALQQNADRTSRYFARLDRHRILVMGQSCGGWEATDASSDPRVDSTIIWNSGTNTYHPTGVLDLHAPTLIAYGGTTDQQNYNAVATYQLASVPIVLASQEGPGHTGWWDDPSDGTPPPGPYQDVPAQIAAKWLAATLYGSRTARHFFVGADCGLCSRPDWTVESKNWNEANQR